VRGRIRGQLVLFIVGDLDLRRRFVLLLLYKRLKVRQFNDGCDETSIVDLLRARGLQRVLGFWLEPG
jgi:hypothetical protein